MPTRRLPETGERHPGGGKYSQGFKPRIQESAHVRNGASPQILRGSPHKGCVESVGGGLIQAFEQVPVGVECDRNR